MRKNKQQLSIRRHLFYLTTLLLGIIILNSCTKIDTDKLQMDIPINKIDITEKFFYASPKTDVITKRVLENLKEKNSKFEFVENFVMENGYPIWDKAIISTKTRSYNSIINSVSGQTDTIIQIPLVLPNTSKVNGFIAAVLNDSINYNLYIGKDYYKYSFNDVPEDSINADKAAMQIMLLDKAVFGFTDFAINDNRLFSNQNNYNINAPQRIIKISNNNGNIGNIVPACESVIIDWFVIDCGFYGNCTINWYQQINVCPNYGGGSGGGIPSGGGSPFPPPLGGTGIPCSGCGSGPSGSPNGTGSGGTGNGGLGWTPTPINPAIVYVLTTMGLERDEDEAIWFGNSSHLTRAIEIQNYLVLNNNSPEAIAFCRLHLNLMMSDPLYLNFVASRPNNIQTTYYSYLTEVENDLVSNPCLKSVTNTITKGKLQTLVYDLFKKEQAAAASAKPKFKIKFKFEEVTSLPDNKPATTQDLYAQSSPTTISGAEIIVKLNTTVLAGKSKEWITSVILHEICHAIRKADAVNANFPLFPFVITQEEEHTKMIEMKHPLDIYNNLMQIFPNANMADMKDLAIGGFSDVLFSSSGTLLNNTLTTAITGAGYFPGINISNAYDNTIPDYKNLTNGKGTICN
jgi:hypothetical protein